MILTIFILSTVWWLFTIAVLVTKENTQEEKLLAGICYTGFAPIMILSSWYFWWVFGCFSLFTVIVITIVLIYEYEKTNNN